tara:strand:+ start:541 stop:789 length:249 start_codon:yes stop_codon:yes gene_type:complete
MQKRHVTFGNTNTMNASATGGNERMNYADTIGPWDRTQEQSGVRMDEIHQPQVRLESRIPQDLPARLETNPDKPDANLQPFL